MKPKLFRVILPVSDINRAARFYETALGVQGMRVSKGRHYIDCDGVILACFDPRADGDAYDSTPNPEWIYFAVDDIRQMRDALVARGVQFRTEPHKIATLSDREVWLADFEDTEGNTLALMSEPRLSP